MKNGKKIVFFQGTFDLLNLGHVRAFELAKSHGDYLIVGLNSDSLIRWFKHREPILPYFHREAILRAIKWIDEVVECHEPAAIRYLRTYHADVYVLTEEWKEAQAEAIDYMTDPNRFGGQGEVVFSPRWEDVLCGTDIRRKLFAEFGGGK